MVELIKSYWWIAFPMAWLASSLWNRWMDYRATRDRLDLVKAYVAQGKEPPAELIFPRGSMKSAA